MSHLVFRSADNRISIRSASALPLAVAILCLCLCCLGLLSLSWGSYPLEFAQIWQTLITPHSGETETTILWELRLPRFVAAALVGCMLGLSGAILQGVTRNGLADPSLVGISQGASLLVVSLIVMWPTAPVELRPIAGFVGALLTATLVQWVAAGKTTTASLRFVLVGIGVSATISAGTNAMLTYGQINQASAALAWLAGSVHTVSWRDCTVLAAGFALLLPGVIWASRPLAAMRFGPEIAIGLGLNLRRYRNLLVLTAVALAALSVSIVGPLGFIGLIAPHFARRLVRCGVGGQLIATALVGSALVTLADLLGRTAFAPIQLPAGLISAAIGAPVFILLIFKRAGPQRL